MNETILTRLFEHNHWANVQLIQVCSSLTYAQLDAEPQLATKGSIRTTLAHLIDSQEDYLSQLLGIEALHLASSPGLRHLTAGGVQHWRRIDRPGTERVEHLLDHPISQGWILG